MILLTKAGERRTIDQGKFTIRLIFPGVKLHNLKDVGLGPLGRVDHATLDPGMVVPMHPHQNDEILSYLRKGTMIHKDTAGHQVPVHPAHLMMMNSGSGIEHEEAVPADSETVEMLQVFIRPEKENLEPAVQFHAFNEPYSVRSSLLAPHS
jgi:redox-sensitive bicupin YhaK (pirin superfamily)